MSRRPTPERLETARREAALRRLEGVGMNEASADLWIAALATQAALDGVEPGAGYWDAARRWISEPRRSRVRPL